MSQKGSLTRYDGIHPSSNTRIKPFLRLCMPWMHTHECIAFLLRPHLPVASLLIQRRNTWSFPRLKNTPFFARFQVHVQQFWPLFYMKTGTNYLLKTTLFWHFKYPFTKSPLSYTFKNTQKLPFFITCTQIQ